MRKVRIHELASRLRDQGVQLDNKELVAELQSMDFDVKSHSSELFEDQAAVALDKLLSKYQKRAPVQARDSRTGPVVRKAEPRVAAPNITRTQPGGDMTEITLLRQSIADLIGVVARQQQQIAALRRQVEASSLMEVQTRVADAASKHLRTALEDAAKSLKDLGAEYGEVTIGTVVQEGTIAAKQHSKVTADRSDRNSSESESGTSVEVEAELKGVLGKLAGASGSVGVDVTRAQKRLNDLHEAGTREESQSMEGTFKVRYDGPSIKVGRPK